MRNVTITLQEEVAQWARVWAVKHHRSLSRFISQLLQKRMSLEKGYEAAMQHFLNRRPKRLKKGGKYPTRDELYD